MSERRTYPVNATATVGKPVLNDRDFQVVYTGPAARHPKDFARFTVVRRDGGPTPPGTASAFVSPGEAAVLPFVRDGGPLLVVFRGNVDTPGGPAVAVSIVRASPQITALADAAMDNTAAALTVADAEPTDAEILSRVAEAYQTAPGSPIPVAPPETPPPVETGRRRKRRRRDRDPDGDIADAPAAVGGTGGHPGPFLAISPLRSLVLRTALGHLMQVVSSDLETARRVAVACRFHSCGDPAAELCQMFGAILGEIPHPFDD